MTSAASRTVAMVLALLLLGAGRGESIGFADLPQLIGAHPLYGVLAQYDREIAALRGTRSVSGLTDPAARWTARGPGVLQVGSRKFVRVIP